MKAKSPKHVFISFKTEEENDAVLFKQALEQSGYAVWWQVDLQCGHEWHGEIDKALNSAGAVVVLWSKLSHNSQWVRHEASQAMAMNRYAPVRLEAFTIDNPYDRIQATDINNWNGELTHPGFQNLLKRLQELMPPVLTPQKKVLTYLVRNRILLASLVFAAMALWFLTRQNNFLAKQSKTSEEQTGNLATITARIKDQRESLSSQTESVNSILHDLKLQKLQYDTQIKKQQVILASLDDQRIKLDKQFLLQASLVKSTEKVITNVKAVKYPLSSLNVLIKFRDSIPDSLINTIDVTIEFFNTGIINMKNLKIMALNKSNGLPDYLRSTIGSANYKIAANSIGSNTSASLGLPANRYFYSAVFGAGKSKNSDVNSLLDLENSVVIVTLASINGWHARKHVPLDMEEVSFYIGNYQENHVISLSEKYGSTITRVGGYFYCIGEIGKDEISEEIF